MSLAEEFGTNQQFHHRVSEQEDDSNIDHGCHTESEREALHATDCQQVEDDSCNQVHGIGDEDRALSAIPALVDCGSKRATVTDLVTHAFEVDDERVSGDADRHNQACNACERQTISHRRRQKRDHDVGECCCNK